MLGTVPDMNQTQQWEAIAKAKAANFRNNCLARAKKLGIDKQHIPMPRDFYAWLLSKEDRITLYRKRLYIVCEYTGERVPIAKIEIDHNHPISRGGSFGLENLAITSAKNNQQKGELTADEYKKLLGFLDELNEKARTNVLARLRSGGGARFR